MRRVNKVVRALITALRRPVPYAVLSWRYVLPRQSAMVRSHKAVFLGAFPYRSRFEWCCLGVYSFGRWYLFGGWVAWARALRKHLGAEPESKRISRVKQCLGAWWLTFAHSTPPVFYFWFRLFQVPERLWLENVFSHELPHWHLINSPHMSDAEQNLLTDKMRFAHKLSEEGLPFVPALFRVAEGEGFPVDAVLAERRSLFLKPVKGSQRQGCFELIFNEKLQGFSLISLEETEKALDNPREVLGALPLDQSYLVQPLLENHCELVTLTGVRRLITFRVVSKRSDSEVQVIAANMEVTSRGKTLLVPIGLTNGMPLNNQAIGEIWPGAWVEDPEIETEPLSFWKELLEVARRTHELLPNCKTVGWDFAYASDYGLRLLEGNFNWSVAPHQRFAPLDLS